MSNMPRERRLTELGWEVRCACCGEFWPEDAEFYFFHGGKPHSWCKACYRSDAKVVQKVERWKEKQRKHPAPPVAQAPDWTLLQIALHPQGPQP